MSKKPQPRYFPNFPFHFWEPSKDFTPAEIKRNLKPKVRATRPEPPDNHQPKEREEIEILPHPNRKYMFMSRTNSEDGKKGEN